MIKNRLAEMLTDKPQTRDALRRKLHISDRELRHAVRDLRLDGFPVCSNSRTSGYWIGDKDDVERLVNDLTSRGVAALKAASRLSQRELEGQIDLLDRRSCR